MKYWPLLSQDWKVRLVKLFILYALANTWLTCRELKIVKSQANTVVFELTANNPRTQVTPSKGSNTREAINSDLQVNRIKSVAWKRECSKTIKYEFHAVTYLKSSRFGLSLLFKSFIAFFLFSDLHFVLNTIARATVMNTTLIWRKHNHEILLYVVTIIS